MRIWKLTPTNPADPIWTGKWSIKPIIVRAEGEREARHLAVLKTTKFVASVPGMPIPVNPWGGFPKIGDPSPTMCDDITDQTSEFSANGAAEVLRHGEKF